MNDLEHGDSIGGRCNYQVIARKQSSRNNFTRDVAWPREISRLGSPRRMWAAQALALQQLQKPGKRELISANKFTDLIIKCSLKKLHLIKKMAQRRASSNSRFVLGLKHVLECQQNCIFGIYEIFP